MTWPVGEVQANYPESSASPASAAQPAIFRKLSLWQTVLLAGLILHRWNPVVTIVPAWILRDEVELRAYGAKANVARQFLTQNDGLAAHYRHQRIHGGNISFRDREIIFVE